MAKKINADPKRMAVPSGLDMMTAIWNEASDAFQKDVPQPTIDNIKEVGNPILTYQARFNEAASALVNKIAFTIISSKSYNNPLSWAKRGIIEVGETIEEIFIDLVKAEPYYMVDAEGKNDCQDLLEQRQQEIKAAFHTRNRQDKYVITIKFDDLRAAFTSWDALENLVRRKVDAAFSSDQYDEFELMKNLFYQAGQRGALYEMEVPQGENKDELEETTAVIREMVLSMPFMSDKYNYLHVKTHSNREDMVLFVTPRFYARMDVLVLAAAFNMEKADFLSRVVVVDDFGGLEKSGVVAILADKDWFMVYDNLFTTRDVENGARLYNNYFLHHWQTLSYSPFKNAIAFTVKPSEVLTVTINPSSLTLTRNAGSNPVATLLTADVTGTGMYNPDVVWSTTIGTINQDGLLEVPSTWPNNQGTVTAISKQDSKILDTITVTLVQPTGAASETFTVTDKATDAAPKSPLNRTEATDTVKKA